MQVGGIKTPLRYKCLESRRTRACRQIQRLQGQSNCLSSEWSEEQSNNAGSLLWLAAIKEGVFFAIRPQRAGSKRITNQDGLEGTGALLFQLAYEVFSRFHFVQSRHGPLGKGESDRTLHLSLFSIWSSMYMSTADLIKYHRVLVNLI